MVKKRIKKWSLKYDSCIKCWTKETKYHWRWLCKNCHNKEWNTLYISEETYKRQNLSKIKYSYKKRLLYIISDERIKKIFWKEKQKIKKASENYRKMLDYNNEYRKEKRLINRLIKEIEKRKELWLYNMQVYIEWELFLFPFENLDRPRFKWNQYKDKKAYDKESILYKKELLEYKERLENFEKLKKYYSNWNRIINLNK